MNSEIIVVNETQASCTGFYFSPSFITYENFTAYEE